MKPTHLDLFSGIGGFVLAAQWAGFETIGFSEIDPYASQILKKHWPTVPNYGDVRTVPTLRCDLITGGFPCQPFSVAGKRRGKEDNRHLWPAMRDVIERCEPTWVCGENVPGIIGVELDKVLFDLESLGYRVQPLVIPACAVDAPHRRDRVWIVAHSGSQRNNGRNGECGGPESTGSRHKPIRSSEHAQHVAYTKCPGLEEQCQQSTREECPATQRSGETVGDANGAHRDQARREAPGQIRHAGEPDSGCRGPEDIQHWSAEPNVGRVAHGIPNRVDRLRGLGNSIVPQVAQVILQAIRQTLT